MILIGWIIGRAVTPPRDGEKTTSVEKITKVQEIAVQTVRLPADGIELSEPRSRWTWAERCFGWYHRTFRITGCFQIARCKCGCQILQMDPSQ